MFDPSVVVSKLVRAAGTAEASDTTFAGGANVVSLDFLLVFWPQLRAFLVSP